MSSPSTRIVPAVGVSTPSSIDSVVVLPAPLPPSSAVVVPAAHRERDAAHSLDVDVALAQVAHDDRRVVRGCRGVQHWIVLRQ